MLDDKTRKSIIDNFELAEKEFDFCFISPYSVGEENEWQFFGYLFRDNLDKGVVIDFLFDEEDDSMAEKRKYCNEKNIFYSCLNAEPLLGEYKKSYFREMLRDWKDEF